MLVNPRAGRGRGVEAAEQARSLLERARNEIRITVPTAPAEVAPAAAIAARRADLVVAVGGDGTLRAMLAGLPPTAPAGLIPLGTANVVARELGIPRSIAGACAVLTAGRLRALDAAWANQVRCLAMVGVGIDAEVIETLHAGRQGPIRQSSYLLPIARVLRRRAGPRLKVACDGVPLDQPVHDLVICNVRNYAAYFAPTPDARPDDGLLHWVARPVGGLISSLAWLLAAWRGRPAAGLIYGSARALTIEATAEPVLVQADGDPAGTTPLQVRVDPGAVRLCVP